MWLWLKLKSPGTRTHMYTRKLKSHTNLLVGNILNSSNHTRLRREYTAANALGETTLDMWFCRTLVGLKLIFKISLIIVSLILSAQDSCIIRLTKTISVLAPGLRIWILKSIGTLNSIYILWLCFSS